MGRKIGVRQTRWGSKILSDTDAEVEYIVKRCYMKAKRIVESNKPLMIHLAKSLIKQEVVSAEEFQVMLIQFNSKMSDFNLSQSENNMKDMPFQTFPAAI